MKHFDPNNYVLGRVPSPLDLCREYSYRDTVTMLLPLPRTGGLAVILISYSPIYAVIPAAHYNRDGELLRLPAMETNELVRSSRSDLKFPSEVLTLRPLRTAADPRSLAEQWARKYLDSASRDALP